MFCLVESTDTICMTIKDSFIKYIREAAAKDESLTTNLLYPLRQVDGFTMETQHSIEGFQVEPVRIYSEMFKRCDVKRYRRYAFCKIDRFALAEGRDDEAFQARVERTISAIGEVNVVCQITEMLSDFHGETVFNLDPEDFWTHWFEMSFAWVRLICHQLWIGRYREAVAFAALEKRLPEGFELHKSSKEQDTRARFDFYVSKDGVAVLGVSVKSFRYFYSKSSAYRDKGKVEEHSIHRSGSIPVVEVRVDDRLPLYSVEAEVWSQVESRLIPHF